MIEYIKDFIKKAAFELWAGGIGFISTFVIDWRHIAERAIETTIIASINGAVAAVAGYLALLIVKKIFPKK